MQTGSTARPHADEAFERALRARTVCEAFQITAAARAHQVAVRAADGSGSLTYGGLVERVRRAAAGLAALGLKRGDTVGIMLTNRPEFHVVDLAAMHLGATAFSVYNTSAQEQIEYVFADAGNKIVITEQAFLERLTAVRDAGTPIDHIVVVDGEPEGTLGLEQVEALGDAAFDFEATWSSVAAEDVLTLIYTSGTTGPPKGVELTHGNMMSEIRALQQALPVTPGGRTISFLPAAHIGDRWSGHYSPLGVWGFTVTTCADARNVLEVVKQVRPTVFLPVPRIWQKAKAAVESEIAAEPGVAGKLLRWAMKTGVNNARVVQAGTSTGLIPRLQARLAETLVGSKVRRMLGVDQVEWFLTGAAPTPRDVFEFFAAAGIPIREIWAMSETSCVMTVNPPRIRVGTVGLPLPGVEVKVADDGELLVRGATVMKGYRNKPEQTAAAIDPDGWLHTGDIGTIGDDGYVRLVDRKKDIIINAAGKNMSPAAIEAWLKSSSPVIGQAVCIGDGRPYNVALITLDPDAAAGRSAEDPATIAEVAAGVERANSHLSRVEQIKKFKIVAEEWLPGSEELTPTMKVKRKGISAKYAAEIEELYAG